MSGHAREAPFFVGYIGKLPAPLGWFLGVVAALLIGGMAGLALAIGSTIDDPGDGRFDWGTGRVEVTGVMQALPYPVLRLPADAENPEPRVMLLSGQGKRGAQGRADPLDGQRVIAGGVLLKRGAIDMLQIGGNPSLAALEEVPPDLASYEPAAPVDLGRWRLTGEICDGKCYQGAMRPGRGLSHKACANLCLIGGAPPVFVSSGAVDGNVFFLMADETGRPLDDRLRDYVALMVSVEGRIERIDNLMVFKVDLDTIEVL